MKAMRDLSFVLLAFFLPPGAAAGQNAQPPQRPQLDAVIEKMVSDKIAAAEERMLSKINHLELVANGQTEITRAATDAAKVSNAWVQHWITGILSIVLSVTGIILTVVVGAIAWTWRLMSQADERYAKKLEAVAGSEVIKDWTAVEERFLKLKYQNELENTRLEALILVARSCGFARWSEDSKLLLESVNLVYNLCSGTKRGVDQGIGIIRSKEEVSGDILLTVERLSDIYRKIGLAELSENLKVVSQEMSPRRP